MAVTIPQDYQALESRVRALELIINNLMTRSKKQPDKVAQFNVQKEVRRRGLTDDTEELKRIALIMADYDITPEQICSTLDKVAIMARREPIHNICGYINNTMRKEHTYLHKDYAGLKI